MPCSNQNVSQEQPGAGLSIHGSLYLTQACKGKTFQKQFSCLREFRYIKIFWLNFYYFSKNSE